MTGPSTTKAEVQVPAATRPNDGLHANVLGPVETLAQSVSAVAPSTTPSLTIPLVFAMAGNATWFVYLLATLSILLVGFCVSRFARLSASPGSLYTYAASALPPVWGELAAWGLLLAYIATGASVAGGALYYAGIFAERIFHTSPPASITLAATCAAAAYVAWRDVKLSAELMLWIEAVSVTLIVLVLATLAVHFGIHLDPDQFRLKGVSIASLGPALVLAMFSFVGFESATTLGGEARNPLRTIPRAVIQCALLTGAFFTLCSYAEVVGFRGQPENLASSTSPLHFLAIRAGISMLGTLVDLGAMISMFACVLACITAASRVLLRMGVNGLLPPPFHSISERHGTPWLSVLTAARLMFALTWAMSMGGVPGSGMYDLMGSLAVFGFLTAYALVALALPAARRARGERSPLVTAACLATFLLMILIVIFDLQATPDRAHARLPYLYLAYLAAGLVWYALRRRHMTLPR